MIQFIRHLTAIPARALLWLSDIVPIFDKLKLANLIWRLTADPEDSIQILGWTTAKYGIATTREIITSMLKKSPDCQLIASMCWLEIYNKNTRGAQEWIKMAEDSGYDRYELLYPVRLFLADLKNKAIISEEILLRNDLPLNITQEALFCKAKLLLANQQWNEANEIAKKILSVEDWPVGNWIRWVINVAHNNENDAKIEIRRVQKELSHGQSSSLIALGWLYLNNSDKASEALLEAVHSRHNIEYISGDLVEYSKTPEFKAYCERMAN